MFVFHFSFVKANNVGLWRLGMKNPRNSPQSRRYARLVAPIIERIDSGCASISMRVLISLTAPVRPKHQTASMITLDFMEQFKASLEDLLV